MRFLALGLAIGLLVGWWLTDSHYTKVMAVTAENVRKAEAIREKLTKVETDKYYGLYKDLLDATPVFIDRVVHVKTAGTVRANTSGCLDATGDAPRVELDAGVVRSVEQVTNKHEKLYEQCAIQLRANQTALKSMLRGSYR